MLKKYQIHLFLVIGLAASIIVGLGEYLLHYLPEGPAGEIDMLNKVPLSRARIGHFLAIFGAPLYFVAYYGLRLLFQSTHDLLSKLLFYLGVSAFFFGSIWISSRFFAAVVFQHSLGQDSHSYFVEMYEANYQILVWFLRIIILLLSLTFVALVVKNKIGIPKWFAVFNPIFLLIIVISSLLWFPDLGKHIAPIAMNVTHFVFFSIILFQLNKLQEVSLK